MSSVSATSSALPLTAADLSTPAATTTKKSSALGKDDFMKLLMAQMRNQNPLDPQSASEFASQMAQFSSLEGINQLNTNFSSLLQLQGLNQGANLIGKPVSYTTGSSGQIAQGIVQAVRVESGQVQLVIGGRSVPLTQLSSIGPTS